jgi:hypothetical protein
MIRTTMMFVLLTGCGTSSDQRVTGKVMGATFPAPITHVRAVGNASTIEARVAADGSFALNVPGHDRYRIELHAAVRKSDIVFPRATGVIQTTFYVAQPGAAIDLGRVRYVADPATTPYDYGECKTHPEGGNVCVEDGDGGGKDCGGEVGAPEGASDPGAVAEKNPPEAIGCEGDEGGGGGQDEGGGGQDPGGGGGQDEGGGGQDPGGGGQDEGGGGGG